MTANAPTNLLNTQEAAEYLRVSASYLAKLRMRSSGPKYVQLGVRVLYDLRDLNAWVEDRKRALPNNSEARP